METAMINHFASSSNVVAGGQQPDKEDKPEKKTIKPRNKDKWVHMVDMINRICAVVMDLFDPRDPLYRFHHAVELFRETR